VDEQDRYALTTSAYYSKHHTSRFRISRGDQGSQGQNWRGVVKKDLRRMMLTWEEAEDENGVRVCCDKVEQKSSRGDSEVGLLWEPYIEIAIKNGVHEPTGSHVVITAAVRQCRRRLSVIGDDDTDDVSTPVVDILSTVYDFRHHTVSDFVAEWHEHQTRYFKAYSSVLSFLASWGNIATFSFCKVKFSSTA